MILKIPICGLFRVGSVRVEYNSYSFQGLKASCIKYHINKKWGALDSTSRVCGYLPGGV